MNWRNSMKKNEEILVLEINGKKNIIEYQRKLYEASVLGISHVMFLIVLDDIKRHQDNINSMQQILYETCKILKIKPSTSVATVYGEGSFIGTSVGTLNENGNIYKLSNLPKFSNYKRRKSNQGRLATAEEFEKVYSKKLQQI